MTKEPVRHHGSACNAAATEAKAHSRFHRGSRNLPREIDEQSTDTSLARFSDQEKPSETTRSRFCRSSPTNPVVKETAVHVDPRPTPTTRVREYRAVTKHDSTLSTLRDLFVRSFDTYYKDIEEQLNLKSGRTLIQWLEDTFDEMQEEMLCRTCRCFLICSELDEILGFLTLKEEKDRSVYIAQCAIRAETKRQGYGRQLLQHLATIYPAGTHYWGLCRRANRPAVQFYIKQGARYMDDDDVANKYGYDPNLYTGFEFVDLGNVRADPTIDPSSDDNQSKKNRCRWWKCLICSSTRHVSL